MKAKLLKIWDHFEEYLLVYSFMVSVVLITLQVIFRYVLHNSLSWSEELARYMFVWQTWIGVSYSARNGSHLRITLLRDRLPQKGKYAMELFVMLVWITFSVWMVYLGCRVVGKISGYGQRSSALGIPMKFCYASVPVGMGLLTIRLVVQLIKLFKNGTMTFTGGENE